MAALSDRITQRYPSLYKYKPGIEFLARLFLFGAIAIFIKFVYGYFADPSGSFFIQGFGKFSLIELLRNTLLKISFFILHLLEPQAFLEGWAIGLRGRGGVRLETPCLGINVCLIFTCLILSYPVSVSLKKIILFLVGGLVLVQAINIARIIGMVYVVANKYSLPIEHHDLFNIIVYLIVISLFYYFTTLDQADLSTLKPKYSKVKL